jgi:hypothetical protein
MKSPPLSFRLLAGRKFRQIAIAGAKAITTNAARIDPLRDGGKENLEGLQDCRAGGGYARLTLLLSRLARRLAFQWPLYAD